MRLINFTLNQHAVYDCSHSSSTSKVVMDADNTGHPNDIILTNIVDRYDLVSYYQAILPEAIPFKFTFADHEYSGTCIITQYTRNTDYFKTVSLRLTIITLEGDIDFIKSRMKLRRGRSEPYTQIGVKRLKCIRCGGTPSQQWQICSDSNLFRPLCDTCDIKLNQFVLQFMLYPDWRELMLDYRDKVYNRKGD